MGARAIAGVLMMSASSASAMDATRLMSELVWERRVLLVFTPDPENAEFRRQDAVLEAVGDGLIERDMTVIRAFANDHLLVDRKRCEQSATSFYRYFAVKSDEFKVILIGKDGTLKLNRNSVVTDYDLFALIDSMPMRRREMLEDG